MGNLSDIPTQKLIDEIHQRHEDYNSKLTDDEYYEKGEEDVVCWLKYIERVEGVWGDENEN